MADAEDDLNFQDQMQLFQSRDRSNSVPRRTIHNYGSYQSNIRVNSNEDSVKAIGELIFYVIAIGIAIVFDQEK